MMQFIQPTYIIAILIAISVHEWAHAYAAHKLGDPTAEREGRLTLNPIAHIDPLGALMFVLVGFGWAKPVPVNPMYFKHPNRDMAIVAVAGPFSNLILAIIAVTALMLVGDSSITSSGALLSNTSDQTPAMAVLLGVLRDSLFVNLALMAFNLFPIAPLDGSNILRTFIPRHLQDRYEDFVRIGPWILLGLLLVESFLRIPLLSVWVHSIVNAVMLAFGWVISLLS